MEAEIVRLRQEMVTLKEELASARLKHQLPRRLGFEDFAPNGVIVCFETADGVTEFMTEFSATEQFGGDVLEQLILKRCLGKARTTPSDPGWREYRRCNPERIAGGCVYRFREVVPVLV